MTPLNLKGEDFCNMVGLAYHSNILKCLRELNLVRFFKIGKKYMYYTEDVTKVNNLLREGKIEIKTSNGYYITKKG